MTVTNLDTAADREDDDTCTVLAEYLIDHVKAPAAALAGTLDGGEGDEPDLVAWLTAGRSYAELRAMLLLLADCADPVRVTEACGLNPGLSAANARRAMNAWFRALEYAHLRDGGVSPEQAAERCDVRSATREREYERAYQEGRAA